MHMHHQICICLTKVTADHEQVQHIFCAVNYKIFVHMTLTGSNESGIAMTASPSHDTKDLTFTLGTSPTRKGDVMNIIPLVYHCILVLLQISVGLKMKELMLVKNIQFM